MTKKTRKVEIAAQKGPQERFLASPAAVVIYGGAAGGGKTFGLLLEPIRHIHNSEFGAVIFRRSYPQIMMEGGLWDEAEKLYTRLGAFPRKGLMAWVFPTGARVRFAHLGHESHKQNYQGAQIPLLMFDQLEQFAADEFWFLFSRNRSTSGVRPYIRATCNPDPDSFVAPLISWWLGDDGYPIVERSGIIRWFVRIGARLEWADSPEDLVEKFGEDAEPTSLTFIASSVYDNKILLAKDPAYLARLKALLPVERERLLYGNWKIRAEAGMLFHRDWFEIVKAVPAGGVEVRFWDFAATEKELKGREPAYTAAVLQRKVGGIYYIMHSTDVQEGPAKVDRMFHNVALQDAQRLDDSETRYMVRWEVEPGSAGKRENARLIRTLAGLDAKGVRPQGEKVTRALPFAIQAQAGNVKLLAGPWNERWLIHMHHQPDLKEKDIMDATSGGFIALTHQGGSWRG